MVVLRHKHLNDITIILFTTLGSHLLAERTGFFVERLRNARAVLIDNGVYHLIKTMKVVDYREVVKYGYRNIMRILRQLYRKDLDIYIVIPDYPFNHRLNYECYRIFTREFSHIVKNYKTIYVLHGYWRAILDNVDVDLLAVPFNTFTDIEIKDLRGRRTCRVDSNVAKYVLTRVIQHVKTYGYGSVHLLGATGLTLKRLFKPLEKPCTTLDGVTISNDVLRHVHSVDTTCFHLAPRKKPGEKYLLPSREVEHEWFNIWVRDVVQIFDIVEY